MSLTETLTNVAGPSSIAQTSEAPSAPPAQAQPEPQKPDPKEEDMSRRFAALSRQQKKLLEEQQRFKSEAKQYQEWLKLKDQAKQNPLDYLKAAQLSPDEVIEHLLSDGQPSLEKQVKQLQEKLEAEERRKQEQEQARLEAEEKQKEQQIIDNFKGQIKELVYKDTDRFEAIAALKVEDQVWDIISAHFDQTGELMPIDKAAEQLESQIIDGAKTLLKIKKLAEFTKPTPTETPESTPETATAPTLTNKIAQSSVTQPPSKTVWNRDESLKKAAAFLQWTERN